MARISAKTGAIERLVDIKGPLIYTVTSLVWNPSDRHLYYTTDNGAHRDLVRLDPATGRTKQLQKDLRVGDLAYNAADRSLWGIRHLNGLVTLVQIKPPYTDWERVITWPYGTVMYDLDVSPDGTRVSASFGEISGKQDVRVFDIAALRAGDTTPLARFDFDTAVPNGFVFSPDGRYLYGSSYYTGVSNIFRYDLDAKKVDAVSNTETGLFRPVPLADGRLLVFRYTGRGFVPAWIDPKPLEDVSAIEFLGERLISEQPVLKSWMLDSPAKIPFDTMEKTTGTYGLGGRLRRESIFPIVEGYKDSASVGVALNLSDPLMLNRLHITAGWSPTTSLPMHERLHLSADYERYDWRAAASFNDADFYDLFGPTKVGRKGYSALVGHRNTLIFDEPRRLELDLSGRVSGNLDQLPDYQNVPVDVEHAGHAEGGARLHATSATRSDTWTRRPAASGRWSCSTDVVDGESFPKLFGTFDRGIGLRLGHSSFWMRTAAGFSPRSRTEPFANFFFGGFGNNYVDHGDEKRYRHVESFPGVELNEIAGRNFAKATLEWNLPPWRFARLGTPGLHATWLRPAVFVTGLTTNVDDDALRRTAVSAGGQVDVRFTILSNLDMTFSAGARDRGRGRAATQARGDVLAQSPAMNIVVALVPVLLLLVLLQLMDSFKLVRVPIGRDRDRRGRCRGGCLPVPARRDAGAGRHRPDALHALRRAGDRGTVQGRVHRAAALAEPDRLPGRRGGPGIRRRSRIRAGGERGLSAAPRRRRSRVCGSCAVSARRFSTARRPRCSR